MLHGEYRFWLPRLTSRLMPPLNWVGEPDLIVPNRVTDEGLDEFLRMIMRNESEVAGGGNFYVGLCNQTPTKADGLTDITSEPTSQGGYARQAITRDAAGFPSLVEVNGHRGIRSAVITFTAASDDFSALVSRAFMTDQASGSSGVLYSYSGALTTPISILDGQSFGFQYTLWGN